MGYGEFSDFDTNWYSITGDIIVETMILNAITPPITVLGIHLISKLQMAWD